MISHSAKYIISRAKQEKPKEKTIFNVKLESFEAANKSKIIREVKAMNPTLTLVAVRSTANTLSPCLTSVHYLQAKNFVESLPKVLKENMPKEEAEKLKKLFEGIGAVVVLE